jgi:hypothetical protein
MMSKTAGKTITNAEKKGLELIVSHVPLNKKLIHHHQGCRFALAVKSIEANYSP